MNPIFFLHTSSFVHAIWVLSITPYHLLEWHVRRPIFQCSHLPIFGKHLTGQTKLYHNHTMAPCVSVLPLCRGVLHAQK
eukprot:c25050_g9_i1 orf=113-349(+)